MSMQNELRKGLYQLVEIETSVVPVVCSISLPPYFNLALLFFNRIMLSGSSSGFRAWCCNQTNFSTVSSEPPRDRLVGPVRVDVVKRADYTASNPDTTFCVPLGYRHVTFKDKSRPNEHPSKQWSRTIGPT